MVINEIIEHQDISSLLLFLNKKEAEYKKKYLSKIIPFFSIFFKYTSKGEVIIEKEKNIKEEIKKIFINIEKGISLSRKNKDIFQIIHFTNVFPERRTIKSTGIFKFTSEYEDIYSFSSNICKNKSVFTFTNGNETYLQGILKNLLIINDNQVEVNKKVVNLLFHLNKLLNLNLDTEFVYFRENLEILAFEINKKQQGFTKDFEKGVLSKEGNIKKITLPYHQDSFLTLRILEPATLMEELVEAYLNKDISQKLKDINIDKYRMTIKIPKFIDSKHQNFASHIKNKDNLKAFKHRPLKRFSNRIISDLIENENHFNSKIYFSYLSDKDKETLELFKNKRLNKEEILSFEQTIVKGIFKKVVKKMSEDINMTTKIKNRIRNYLNKRFLLQIKEEE